MILKKTNLKEPHKRKSLDLPFKKNPLKRPFLNSKQGVSGNTDKPHHSSHQIHESDECESPNQKFYKGIITSLKTFFHIFNINIKDCDWTSLLRRLIIFGKDNDINIVIKSFKYFCYYRFNSYIGDSVRYPIPEYFFDFHPNPHIKSYLNKKLSTKKTRNLSFLISLMCLKRCLPVVPDSVIEKSISDHKKILTKENYSDYDEALQFTREFITRDLVRLGKHKLDADKVYSLSRSSSFTTSIKRGGCQNDLTLGLESQSVKLFVHRPVYQTTENLISPSSFRIRKLAPSPLLNEGVSISKNVTTVCIHKEGSSLHGDPPADNHNSDHEFPSNVKGKVNSSKKLIPYESTSLLKLTLTKCAMKLQYENTKRESLRTLSDSIHGNARVCSITEPLKVRTVTCEEKENFLLKSVQKYLWKNLLDKEEFLLTRTSNSDEILTSLHKHFIDDTLPLLISGDYSSATDNLNPFIIKNVLQEISMYLPPIYSQPFIKNGGRHFLNYKDGEIHIQTNGQLMGSLTSFPLLCYINYIAFHHARSLCPEGLSLHCLINGDDIFFRATPEGYTTWQNVVTQYGLDPSPGKNYSSERVFLINSRYFSLENDLFKEIPFVNFGLLQPICDQMLKINEIKDTQEWDSLSPPIGSIYRTFLRQGGYDPITSADNGVFKRYTHLFIKRHHKSINRTYREPFVPSILGGLGMFTLSEFKHSKFLSKERKAEIINGFRFRICLYGLRENYFSSRPDHINMVNDKLGEALTPHSKEDPEEHSRNYHLSPNLSFIEKVHSRRFNTLNTFLKRIGKSSFNKSRKPDGVPCLL